jgi:hypothetical protein
MCKSFGQIVAALVENPNLAFPTKRNEKSLERRQLSDSQKQVCQKPNLSIFRLVDKCSSPRNGPLTLGTACT